LPEVPVLPVIALTLGDPAGTGPELLTKALAQPEVRALGRLLVVGDAATLDRAQHVTGTALVLHPVSRFEDARFEDSAIDVLDLANVDAARFQPGRVDPMCGQAAYEAIRVATARNFALAVQWHPEWECAQAPDRLALFAAFGAACRDYRAATPLGITRVPPHILAEQHGA
ncbi:MAG: hypothetical protein POH28_13080, partial [Acidocella sp.]|nr:hypothetical protein [Acidocella sp.]